MDQQLERWFYSTPPVTRAYLSAVCLATTLTTLEVISPHSLYLNWKLVGEGEVWRVLTNFAYIGEFGVEFAFQAMFLHLDASALEEHGRTSRFAFVLLTGALVMLAIAWFFRIDFMSHTMTFMITYIWSKRNPDAQIALCGFLVVSAPLLPWVLLIADACYDSSGAFQNAMGIAIGHVIWYVEDVVPAVLRYPHGKDLIPTPAVLEAMFRDRPGALR
eukprot:TRINITY_DN44246_c0_g1_i1.p1 TRINITY_DN44246_c0_g1~~TRINITY_DN44246_c0_g1_i1.p1  ORF type:complete len:217 (+),score=55.12 TRINITY_DN44246_c0_g1_i1:63-713(+)